MMGGLTVEEYLALDRVAEVQSEYHDGEMRQMEYASLNHAILSFKVGAALGVRLRGSSLFVANTVRIRVSPTKFVLPDLLVVSGKAEVTDEHNDTVISPKVIVEILSPSTMDYDCGHKFRLYQRLASFEEYILVFQDQPRVEKLHKNADDSWLLRKFVGLEAVVPLESIGGISLPLSEIYEGIEFPPMVDEY